MRYNAPDMFEDYQPLVIALMVLFVLGALGFILTAAAIHRRTTLNEKGIGGNTR